MTALELTTGNSIVSTNAPLQNPTSVPNYPIITYAGARFDDTSLPPSSKGNTYRALETFTVITMAIYGGLEYGAPETQAYPRIRNYISSDVFSALMWDEDSQDYIYSDIPVQYKDFPSNRAITMRDGIVFVRYETSEPASNNAYVIYEDGNIDTVKIWRDGSSWKVKKQTDATETTYTNDEFAARFPDMYLFEDEWSSIGKYATIDGVFSSGDASFAAMSKNKKSYSSPQKNTDFFYIEMPSNPYRVNDENGTTQSTNANEYTVTMRPVKPYIAIILNGVTGTSVDIEIDGGITSAELEYRKNGETLPVHYVDSPTDDDGVPLPPDSITPISHDVTITVTAPTGKTAGLGELRFVEYPTDVGVTDFTIHFSAIDGGVYEKRLGGVVDYIEGVTLFKHDITVFDDTSKLNNLLSNIVDFKRRRIGFDLTDSWSGKGSFYRTIVGRIADAQADTTTDANTLGQSYTAKFSIEETA